MNFSPQTKKLHNVAQQYTRWKQTQMAEIKSKKDRQEPASPELLLLIELCVVFSMYVVCCVRTRLSNLIQCHCRRPHIYVCHVVCRTRQHLLDTETQSKAKDITQYPFYLSVRTSLWSQQSPVSSHQTRSLKTYLASYRDETEMEIWEKQSNSKQRYQDEEPVLSFCQFPLILVLATVQPTEQDTQEEHKQNLRKVLMCELFHGGDENACELRNGVMKVSQCD